MDLWSVAQHSERQRQAQLTNVCLRSEMHDGIDLLGAEDVVDKIAGRDVALHELVVLVLADLDSNILEARAIGEAVEVDNVVLRVILHESNDDMGGTGSGKARGKSGAGRTPCKRASAFVLT